MVVEGPPVVQRSSSLPPAKPSTLPLPAESNAVPADPAELKRPALSTSSSTFSPKSPQHSPPTMATDDDAHLLGGKAKDRSADGEDVSMVTIMQNSHMLKGERGLHEAARRGDIAIIEELLDQGYKVDSRNNLDRTSLHCAAAEGHLEAVQLLLDRGASVETRDKYGMRPLLWAAWFGHCDVFTHLLVEVGADVRSANKQGMTCLHCAAQRNKSEIVKILFQTVMSPDRLDINRPEKNLRTPLHLAAMTGSTEVLKVLLDITEEAPRKFVAKKDERIKASRILRVIGEEVYDKNGYHPLHLAVAENKEEFTFELLDQNVTVEISVNLPAGVQREAKTPIHIAAEKGHHSLTEKLLAYEGSLIDGCTVKDQTPLHLAVLSGKIDIVELLLDYGADVNAQDYHKSTPLHLAAEANQPMIIDLLVARGADVNAFNIRRQLPLHIAVEAGLNLVVEVLIVAGTNLEEKDKAGKSALYLAARGGFVTLVDMIIKAERQYMLNQTKLCVETQTGYVEDSDDEEEHDDNANGDDIESENDDRRPVSRDDDVGADDDQKPEYGEDEVVPRSLDEGFASVMNGREDIQADADSIENRLLIPDDDLPHQPSPGPSPRITVLVGEDKPIPARSPSAAKTAAAASLATALSSLSPEVTQSPEPFVSNPAAEFATCIHTNERIPFRKGDSVHLPYMRDILWRLGARQLGPQDWKRMAVIWNFSESQIRAIEHQYTGQTSYREHGYRMLLIWLDGLPREDNPIRDLYECLVAVNRRDLAEKIRKRVNESHPELTGASGKCLLM